MPTHYGKKVLKNKPPAKPPAKKTSLTYKQVQEQFKKMSAKNKPVRPVRLLKPLNIKPRGAVPKSAMSKKKK
tara:strand:+ start:16003 stop:16218 length:216 start_codon:yes stop_codon:yes gene_type:complete